LKKKVIQALGIGEREMSWRVVMVRLRLLRDI
jgi:hypothetical protein